MNASPAPPISLPCAPDDRPVLGVETSCDESAVAIFGPGGLLAHRLHSQIDLHARYGGVVPELASRDHIRRLPALVRETLAAAGLTPQDLGAIAYTAGPGLIGALMAGAATATGLAQALGVGLIAVHHMEGHLLAPLLEDPAPGFPFTALLVSGGHTLLVGVEGLGAYTLLGESLDDAAGEAFDKTAKLLGLAYPGGPRLAQLAESGRPGACRFPRPMLDRPGLDFSFSGLKTAAATALAKLPRDESTAPPDAPTRADLARGFEDAVVDTLTEKCRRALDATGHARLVVAGGVGANRRLRAALGAMAARRGGEVFFPRPEFCTDNAAMIALAGWHRRAAARPATQGFTARARWPLVELSPPPGPSDPGSQSAAAPGS